MVVVGSGGGVHSYDEYTVLYGFFFSTMIPRGSNICPDRDTDRQTALRLLVARIACLSCDSLCACVWRANSWCVAVSKAAVYHRVLLLAAFENMTPSNVRAACAKQRAGEKAG